MASVIEDAVRSWLAGRKDYNEILAWVRLEKEYQRNLEAFRRYSAYSFSIKEVSILNSEGDVVASPNSTDGTEES